MATDPRRVKELFVAAIELPDAQARQVFLDQVCGQDAELRERVDVLLAAHDDPASALEKPLAEVAAADPGTLGEGGNESPATIDTSSGEYAGMLLAGRYKLLQQIGEGGMGSVWMAQQTEPVRRLVAVKLIKLGMDSKQVLTRFEAERQALALMDHPNIAKVLDAGTTPPSPPSQGGAWGGGRPFFVMELVKGVPITKYCDEHHLTPRQRLELFMPVCHAIQHAHQKGIIHRDIKPSNVLIALYDDKPVPKVIDFGVAKATGQQLTEQTLHTGFGAVVGTVEYMSPEQASFNQLDVDTRSDIYSLGVLLYELMAGSPPFSRKELENAGMMEMLRVIREQEPPRPSTKLSTADGLPTLAANRGIEPAQLTKLMRGELDWIVMKALEKDRGRRYESANGFAMDVQRYLADEPVLACPPSAGYRFRKFARRNKAAFLMASVIAAALVLAVLALSVSNVLVTQERDEKTKALSDKVTALANESAALIKAKEQTALALEREQEAKKQKKIAEAQELLAKRRYYAAQMNLAVRAWEEGDTPRVLELLETQRPRLGEEDFRAFEWYALWQLCHGQLRFTRPESILFSYAVAYAPDSSLIALGCTDGSVRLLNSADGREVRRLQASGSSGSATVAFSPDGKLLAQPSGASRNEVTLWNVATGEPARVLSGTARVSNLAFSPDGKLLATGTWEGGITLWDIATGGLKDRWQTHVVHGLAFSPDSKFLVTSNSTYSTDQNHNKTLFWDLSARPPRVVRDAQARGIDLAFSADGKHLAVATASTFALVDTQTSKEIPTKRGAWGSGGAVAFVPGSNKIAVATLARSVRILESRTGEVTTFPHQAPVRSLAVAPDGEAIAAIGDDAVLKVWNLRTAANPDVIDKAGYITSLSFSPDGKTLAAGVTGKVRLFETSTARLQRELEGFSLGVRSLAFLRDGQTLAAGSARWIEPGELKVWNLLTGKARRPAPEFNAGVFSVAIAPDERTIAVGGPQGDLVLFDLATGKRRAAVRETLTAVTYSPDGKLLISAGSAGRVTVRDPQTGAVRYTFKPKNAGFTFALACSPDSKLLATGTQTGLVQLWELPLGRLRATMLGNVASIRTVAFLPDGRTLVSANEDGDVKLWDVTTGQERITFRLGAYLAVSADGLTLAAGMSNGKIRILRASRAPEALALKSELNADDPESPLAELGAGDRLWAAGEKQEAEQAYRRANDRLRVLVNQCPHEIGYRRELVRSAINLHLLLSEHEADNKSQQIWKEAHSQYKNLPAEEKQPLARSTAMLGDKLGAAGSKETAFRAYTLATELKPDDSWVWFHRAYAYGGIGEPAKAIPDYEKVVELDPKAVGAWNNLGVAHARLGKEDLALECYTQALAQPTASALPWHNRALVYARKKQWDNAIADYSKALELAPNDAQLWHNRALAYEAAQPEKALADYTKAVELAPTAAASWYNRGRIHFRLKKWSEAAADYAKAIELQPDDARPWFERARVQSGLKRNDLAVADFSKVIELEPKNAAAWNNRGVAQLRLGRLHQAFADHAKAVELAPAVALYRKNHDEIKKTLDTLAELSKAIELEPLRPKTRQKRAGLYAQLELWDRAAQDFAKLAELQPDAWLPRRNLAYVLAKAGKKEEALAETAKALEFGKDDPEAWFSVGHTYRDFAQYRSAINHYDRVIELKPEFADGWQARAQAWSSLKHWDRAVSDYTAAIERGNKLPKAWGLLSKRAQAYFLLERFQEAGADHERAVQMAPDIAQSNNALAWFLATCPDAKLRDPRRAVELAKKATLAAPKAWSHWNTLGVAHYRAGDYKPAVTALEKSIELNQDSTVFDWLFLAMAHQKLGQSQEANRWFHRAAWWVENHPNAFDNDPVQASEVFRFHTEAETVLSPPDKQAAESPDTIDYHQLADACDAEARHLESAGKTAEAEKAYRRALAVTKKLVAGHALNPAYRNRLATAHYLLGGLQQRSGMTADAEKNLRQAIAMWTRLADDVPSEQARRRDAAHAVIHYLTPLLQNSGRAAEAEQGLRRAITDWEKRVADDPDNTEDQRTLIENYGTLSNLLVSAGRQKEAEQTCTKALEKWPKTASLYMSRARVYLALPQQEKALGDFSKAIELAPQGGDTPWWYFERASAYAGLKQDDKALADLTKATELRPTLWDVWVWRGNFYFSRQHWDEAVADFSKAVDLKAPYWPAWKTRGAAYAKLNQWGKAIPDYTQAAEMNPKDATLHNDLAWLLATCPDAKLRQPARAVEGARKAVELAPNEGRFWTTLGVAQYRAADWKAAIETLANANKLSGGGNSVQWFFLAMAHGKLNQRKEAREWYDRAVQWMDMNAKEDEELRRFRSEAEELLEIKKKES